MGDSRKQDTQVPARRASTLAGGGVGLEKDNKQVNKNISERIKCYKEKKTRIN